ncbi:GNAT family N-acetyltransferase [Colwellia psychrerythraea]|uniref:GCN5-related N-acetyltransferase n=1 Tax=Colwellia psychrerythraea TaxID=28229 RepID=A0A099KAV1_COLPS|nr:GNAT family N-acetyltransferase [Colwellia psychrerythraea]KGJ87430.1 GCN5-related N-acetyltransferase [Colwellia psychrerythraea]
MDIRQIEWQQTIPVRHRVLWPEKPPEFCYVDGDEIGIHFGAFVNDVLVCVASIYIEDKNARLRKYATELNFQGQGIGSAVLNKVITYLTTHEINVFWCDARESALSFYQRFGMVRQGERFYKSDVPYYKMSMSLNLPAGLQPPLQ